MGPEVLLGSNQRPERVSNPTLHFLQERTHLRHQTRYALYLVETNHPTCYKQADQQALDLVQVKAHDIRAFVASKAFYGGVSVDQIMQACHWIAHNTFTNLYLKHLTWSDNNNNMYLGSVVAAQQVLDPSPQTSYPRKEKKGGGGGHLLQPSLQESKSQGLGISLLHQDVWVRSFYFFSIYFVLCIHDLLRLSLISFQGGKKL